MGFEGFIFRALARIPYPGFFSFAVTFSNTRTKDQRVNTL